ELGVLLRGRFDIEAKVLGQSPRVIKELGTTNPVLRQLVKGQTLVLGKDCRLGGSLVDADIEGQVSCPESCNGRADSEHPSLDSTGCLLTRPTTLSFTVLLYSGLLR